MGDATIQSLVKLLGVDGDINTAFNEAYISGNSHNVDLTVGDIYGYNNHNFSLPKDLLASSMGKAQFEDSNVILGFWSIETPTVRYCEESLECIGHQYWDVCRTNGVKWRNHDNHCLLWASNLRALDVHSVTHTHNLRWRKVGSLLDGQTGVH